MVLGAAKAKKTVPTTMNLSSSQLSKAIISIKLLSINTMKGVVTIIITMGLDQSIITLKISQILIIKKRGTFMGLTAPIIIPISIKKSRYQKNVYK